jgi:hypothetical protein
MARSLGLSRARLQGRHGFGGGSASVPWTPASLTNLRAWLEATDLVTSGAAVTSWTDLSGVGNTFLPQFVANQPAYSATGFNGTSEPYVTFNGVDDRVRVASFSWGGDPTTQTVAVVYRDVTTTASRRVTGYLGTVVADIRQQVAGPQYVVGAGTVSGNLAMSSARLVIGSYDGANLRLYIGSSLNAGPTALVTTVTTGGSFDIGSASGGGSYANVEVAAVFIMRAAITAGEVASLYAYAASRWGV